MYFLSEGVLQITLVSSSAAFDRMSMAAAEMVQVNTSVSHVLRVSHRHGVGVGQKTPEIRGATHRCQARTQPACAAGMETEG